MKYVIAALFVLLLAACGHPTPEGLIFKTASPDLSIGFRWAEVEVGESEPVPPPVPPCEVIVKGNISTRTGEKIYHVPGQANYESVKIDEAAGEMWFCTEEEAIDAGWRKAGN
jgi:uncharacterized lipoprotein